MSEPINGASEHSEAERCGASEQSERCERCERMNVASNRVALSKPDYLCIETRPYSTMSKWTNKGKGLLLLSMVLFFLNMLVIRYCNLDLGKGIIIK